MELGQTDIKKILDQRYPFLLVDKITKIEDNKIWGIKNISATDPYLQGHFPDDPIYPGVLLIESCTQVGGILISKFINKRGFIAEVKNFKFLDFVVPGDTIEIEVTFLKKVFDFIQVSVIAKVKETIVAKGEVVYSFKNKEIK